MSQPAKKQKLSKLLGMARTKIALRALTSLMVALLVITAALMALPMAVGLKSYVIMTGSMRPEMGPATLVYVKPAVFEDIQVGDAATFQSRHDPSKRFTHRVIAISKEDRTFTTKGDASATEDISPISADNLIGKVVFHIPFAGWLSYAMSNIVTRVAVIVVLALWIALEIEVWLHRKRLRPPEDGIDSDSEGKG